MNIAAALAVVSLVVADAGLRIARARGLQRDAVLGQPAHPAFFAGRRGALAARFLATPLLPVAALLSGSQMAAMTSIAAGITLDRVSFYGCSLQQTTESEIARVEGVLRTGPH